jgi:hypothetical protein
MQETLFGMTLGNPMALDLLRSVCAYSLAQGS